MAGVVAQSAEGNSSRSVFFIDRAMARMNSSLLCAELAIEINPIRPKRKGKGLAK